MLAGFFSSEADLREAWGVWSLWEPLSGCQLGIKKAAKTVVTAVAWEQGRPIAPRNPELVTSRGTEVPYIAFDEVYKHLGFGRRCDGVTTVFKKLQGKVHAANKRMARLVRPSQNGLMLVANALLGGLAAFTGQAAYCTWPQMETLEASWREVHNRLMHRVASSVTVELYSDGRDRTPGRRRRVHMWATGLAALHTTNFNSIVCLSCLRPL